MSRRTSVLRYLPMVQLQSKVPGQLRKPEIENEKPFCLPLGSLCQQPETGGSCDFYIKASEIKLLIRKPQ